MFTRALFLLTASLLLAVPLSLEGRADQLKTGEKAVATTQKPEPSHMGDDRLLRLGEERAQQLGHNPIFVMKDEKGESLVVGGQIAIRNGSFALVEGDMVINVGTRDYQTSGTTLRRGEYAVVGKQGLTKGEYGLLDERKHTADSQTGSVQQGANSEWNSLWWAAAGLGLLIAAGMAVWAWRGLSVRRTSRDRKPVVFPVE